MTTTAGTATDAHHLEGWWAFPLLGGTSVYIIGFLPLPVWVLPALGVTLAGLGCRASRHHWHPDTHGDGFSLAGQWCATLAGLAAGSWWWAAHATSPVHVAAWLAAATLCLGGWHVALAWMAPSRAAAHIQLPPAEPPIEPEDDSLESLYGAILTRAGCGDVTVTQVVVSPSGGVESVHLEPLSRPGKSITTRTAFEGRLPRIAVELDRALRGRPPYTYIGRGGETVTEPVRVCDDDVHIEAGAGGSTWTMHVSVARPLDAVEVFAIRPTPDPWAGPRRCGRYADDKPLMLTFVDDTVGAAMGEIIAQTGGGKTGFINFFVAEHLHSDCGEIWMVGTNKLAKMALPWLMPWLTGRTDRPVIDYIGGEDVQECLKLLASALQFIAETNKASLGNDARKATRGNGGLTIILEEASKLLTRTDRIMCHDGILRDASEMVAFIQSEGRSALVNIFKVNQDALFRSFGKAGPEQRRNIGWGIAGASRVGSDAARVIPDLLRANPSKLRNQAMYIQPLYETPRNIPARFTFVPDPLIPDVAEHCTQWRYGLDPAITSQLPFYAGRWAAVRQQALVDMAAKKGLRWPGSAIDPGHHAPAQIEDPSLTPEHLPAREDVPDATLARPTREEHPVPPQPAQPNPTPLSEDLIPTGFDNPDYDVWSAFHSNPGTATRTVPPAGHDTSALGAAARKVGEFISRKLAESRNAIPEPLRSIIDLLDRSQARLCGVTHVATEDLACELGRFAKDAPPEVRARETARLGSELRALDVASVQLPREVDTRHRRGFSIASLREAARKAGTDGL